MRRGIVSRYLLSLCSHWLSLALLYLCALDFLPGRRGRYQYRSAQLVRCVDFGGWHLKRNDNKTQNSTQLMSADNNTKYFLTYLSISIFLRHVRLPASHPKASANLREESMPSPFTQDTEDVPLPRNGIQFTVATHPFEVEKHYEPRGEWTLHRLASATQFVCGQCKKHKKAKLVATRQGSWDDLCCNTCYGQCLSTEKWSLQQVLYCAHPRRSEDCNDRRVVYWISRTLVQSLVYLCCNWKISGLHKISTRS